MFTKEDKDADHFIDMRNAIMSKIPVIVAKAKKVKSLEKGSNISLGDIYDDKSLLSIIHFYISLSCITIYLKVHIAHMDCP